MNLELKCPNCGAWIVNWIYKSQYGDPYMECDECSCVAERIKSAEDEAYESGYDAGAFDTEQ